MVENNKVLKGYLPNVDEWKEMYQQGGGQAPDLVPLLSNSSEDLTDFPSLANDISLSLSSLRYKYK